MVFVGNEVDGVEPFNYKVLLIFNVCFMQTNYNGAVFSAICQIRLLLALVNPWTLSWSTWISVIVMLTRSEKNASS